MKSVVLESYLGSIYDDTPDSYEFPSRYLGWFGPLRTGEPVFALIYEPRGDRRGRVAYVGWATISKPPVATGKKSDSGQALWRVDYDSRVQPFDSVVPREILGEPIEAWLAEIEPGRGRNVATFGRAVRAITDEDVQRVLALAYGPGLSIDLPYPDMGSLPAEQLVAERTRRAVAVVQRDARFREAVLGTYDFRCAISGFSIGGVSRTRVAGLLDAAHIRPVWEHGPDVVRNGLSLTPTLHRLFDLGMFTLEYERDSLRIVTSPQLEDTMIRAPDDSFRMGLATGIEVRLPQNRALWPDPALLRHHQASTYREAGTPR